LHSTPANGYRRSIGNPAGDYPSGLLSRGSECLMLTASIANAATASTIPVMIVLFIFFLLF
jgi:hypothetical protein